MLKKAGNASAKSLVSDILKSPENVTGGEEDDSLSEDLPESGKPRGRLPVTNPLNNITPKRKRLRNPLPFK